jgi:hypothetical protein
MHLSRPKVILLSALAVLGTSAIASATAMAEKRCDDGPLQGDACLYTAGLEKTGVAFAITGNKKAGTIGIAFRPRGPSGPIVQCENAAISGSLLAQGDGVIGEPIVITYTNCRITTAGGTKCEIKEPVKVTANAIFLDNSSVSLVEAGAGPLAKISILNKGTENCLYATSEGKLTGHQKCGLETRENIETEKRTHILECEASGSALHFNGWNSPMTLTEGVELVSKENWSLGNS